MGKVFVPGSALQSESLLLTGENRDKQGKKPRERKNRRLGGLRLLEKMGSRPQQGGKNSMLQYKEKLGIAREKIRWQSSQCG